MMPRKILSFVLAWVITGLLAALPTETFAAASVFEGNYAVEHNIAHGANNRISICDGEADGDPAFAYYDTTSPAYNLQVWDNNSSGCGAAVNYYLIMRHRTCELKYGGTYVACGYWAYANTP